MTKVLVLGAYGLIGAEVFRAIVSAGYQAIGFGRNEFSANRVLPYAQWRFGDLQELLTADDWQTYLQDITHVVNCAGALQDGASTDLDLIHAKSITALADVCAKMDIGLIQISAVGANLDATTEFMRSKARGDIAIQQSATRYWIIRPGLVIAKSAFGGTQLIRMLASVPWVQPMALADSRIQITNVRDISQFVIHVLEEKVQANQVVDLVAHEKLTLADIVVQHRAWLGLKPAILTMNLPSRAISWVAKGADTLSRLGWRSPLRSTAIQVLSQGIIATPHNIQGVQSRSLRETLGEIPAYSEDRLAARMAILMPVAVAILSIFWLISGVIGMLRLEQAAIVLTDIGWTGWFARASVIFWAIFDIALGAGILIRRFAKLACVGMVCLSLFYLVATTIFVPHLWLDPLGPMIKVLPSIVLAMIVRVMLEER
ncbi:hypothetical protein BFP76_12635 [Amylibacter kogurei]|uniref:NAD-dependent epimerase/dehydratase domain-containing protein n=1 Tax=Paramylibacter kogurei TaxID=1889778 RepID=A0A2G5KA04_9RHOB|nr:SDR family oxidoreductase [Amylibacter kogurei]PIB25843.1 hypothetical protein BFP76_12635 [Amylibacter kogurei]